MQPTRPDVVLFTTTDAQGNRGAELARLLASVAAAQRPGLDIVHFLLVQRGTCESLGVDLPPFVKARAIDGRVSLSRARNLLLAEAIATGALDGSLFVAFPDDDAWYPEGLLAGIAGRFRSDATLDVVASRYGSSPTALATIAPGRWVDRPSAGRFIATVSSNSMFVRSERAAEVGMFDERLGLGAMLNGGEDLDYALRALTGSRGHAGLLDAPVVGHRDREPWVRSRYFAGSLAAILRSAGRRPTLAVHGGRKLAVGVYLVLRGELTPSAYLRDVRLAVAALSARS